MKDFYQIVKLSQEDIDVFEDERGETETIAGFLLEYMKGFPKKNEEIKFHGF